MGFGAATALGSAGTARHSTLRARGGAAECNAPSTSASAEAQAFIDSVNLGYERVHRDFEAQFWGTKMALSEEHRALSGDRASYSVGELTATKGRMEDFLADEAKLSTARRLLERAGELSGEQEKTLRLFARTFGCYIMESDEARKLREEATAIEGELEAARNTMKLGAKKADGTFEEMSSVALRSKLRVDADEAVRKACWEGLRSIGDFVTANGFVGLVKRRNRLARAQGFVDYYDYKVTAAEGFDKATLFSMLDGLEAATRPIMSEARERLRAKLGDESLRAWNTPFYMAGDVTRKLDPYFPFERSVEQWGRSFSALGISYRGAAMDLDLLDRKNKYSNGFCHWPQPAWKRPDGSFTPAVTHFTSLADPSAVGSGLTGLTTLMHEAGHAAHFANIVQPSPLFSQERAPTSVPYAELQSMFLDSLVGDAAWRAKYALSRDGQPLPWNLIEEDLHATHPYKARRRRAPAARAQSEPRPRRVPSPRHSPRPRPAPLTAPPPRPAAGARAARHARGAVL